MLREDLGSKELFVVNDKSTAVGEPREDVVAGRVGEDFVEDFEKV